MILQWRCPSRIVALALALAVGAAGGAAAQGVTVAVSPTTLEVAPGAEFDLSVAVT